MNWHERYKAMKPLLILLLFPTLLQAQYFGIGAEIDARNVIEGSVNLIYKANYTDDAFRAEIFYETHPDIDYESVGINAGAVFNRNKLIKLPLLAQISTIHRPTALVPSLGLIGGLEIHLGHFILQTNLEGKWRSDFEKYYGTANEFRISGRVGVVFKI